MNIWALNIILVFFLCIFLAGIVIPKILLIAFRKNLFDIPEERKIHTSLVPRLGGIAFTPVVFFSISLVIGLNLSFSNQPMLDALSLQLHPIPYGICAVILLYLIGIGDDLIGIRYTPKFIVQILCGGLLIAGGLSLDNLHGFLGIYGLTPWMAIPLTVLLIVFVINAINLIDGIDGLASGLCSVCLITYGIAFFLYEYYICSMLSFATLGVLIPFFYYNVYGDATKQKKIFMGDTGSLTIGVILCLLSLNLTQCVAEKSTVNFNPLVLSFSSLIIPCFDVVRVYFRRVRNGKNPFLPDKTHIHHKLLAFGMSQRVAMLSIVLFSVLVTFVNICMSIYFNSTLILIIDAIVWILLNLWLSKKVGW